MPTYTIIISDLQDAIANIEKTMCILEDREDKELYKAYYYLDKSMKLLRVSLAKNENERLKEWCQTNNRGYNDAGKTRKDERD